MDIEEFNEAIRSCNSQKAIKGMMLVVLGGLTVTQAAKDVGLKRQSLHDQINRRFNAIMIYEKKIKKILDKSV